MFHKKRYMQVKQKGGWMNKWKYEISNDGLTLKAEVDEMMEHASKDLENERFIKSKVTCDRQQWVIQTIQEVPELAEKALHWWCNESSYSVLKQGEVQESEKMFQSILTAAALQAVLEKKRVY